MKDVFLFLKAALHFCSTFPPSVSGHSTSISHGSCQISGMSEAIPVALPRMSVRDMNNSGRKASPVWSTAVAAGARGGEFGLGLRDNLCRDMSWFTRILTVVLSSRKKNDPKNIITLLTSVLS